MILTRTSTPTRVISLTDAKAQLYVLNTREDDYITALAAIAEETIMNRTNTVFSTTNFTATYYNVCDLVRLPVYPVAANGITQVKGRSEESDDLLVLTESEDYIFKDNGVFLLNSESYYELEVVFTAGFTATDFPEALKGAVLMLLGTLYGNRQSEVASVVSKVPYGIEFIIEPHRYTFF